MAERINQLEVVKNLFHKELINHGYIVIVKNSVYINPIRHTIITLSIEVWKWFGKSDICVRLTTVNLKESNILRNFKPFISLRNSKVIIATTQESIKSISHYIDKVYKKVYVYDTQNESLCSHTKSGEKTCFGNLIEEMEENKQHTIITLI